MAKIEVFSGPQCNYCAKAKALLESKGLEYEDLDIASDERHREDLLQRLPRSGSIPQIFIDGEHIGGSEDLEILNKDGRLDRMIETNKV